MYLRFFIGVDFLPLSCKIFIWFIVKEVANIKSPKSDKPKRTGMLWTDEDLGILKDGFKIKFRKDGRKRRLTDKEMSKKLKRTQEAVKIKRIREGMLRKDPTKPHGGLPGGYAQIMRIGKYLESRRGNRGK
jgi:hypothetical protein